MAMEEDEEFGTQKTVSAAVRSAKKASRPSKLTMIPNKSNTAPAAKKASSKSKSKRNFDSDWSARSKNQSSGPPLKPNKAKTSNKNRRK